jgi:hypothetical protein
LYGSFGKVGPNTAHSKLYGTDRAVSAPVPPGCDSAHQTVDNLFIGTALFNNWMQLDVSSRSRWYVCEQKLKRSGYKTSLVLDHSDRETHQSSVDVGLLD